MTIKSMSCAAVCAASIAASGSMVSAQSGGQAPDWSGPYIGASVGYVYLDVDAEYTGPAVGTDLPFTQSMNGFSIGPFAGFNFRQGQFVFGPEVDVSWLIDADSNATPGGAAAMDAYLNGHLRGRAGYLIQDDLLLYAGLGVAMTAVEITRVPAGLTPTDETNSLMFGLSAGVGAEYALTDDIHLRLDYIYDHYFKQTIADTELLGAIPFFPEIRAKMDSHTIRVGASIDLY